jgi:IPT/TIG domain
MLKNYLAISISLCAGMMAAQGPVYKLIYSPPTLSTGYINTLREVQPGLFYALSLQKPAVIFSVTKAGTFKSIYTFPATNNYTVTTMVQGANARLYGVAFNTAGYYYYSISVAGTGLQQYPFPGQYPNQWGPLNQGIAAPPGQFYDLVLGFTGSVNVYGLAQILETGQINILHQMTPAEGYPNVAAVITPGPGGNIYSIATEQPAGSSPSFIFSFTPAGVYSRLANLPSAASKTPDLLPLVGADGNLYGAIARAGTNKTGEMYEATTSGQLQVTASFPATGMARPATLMQATDGNIYGSTENNAAGDSWIFKYDPATKQLTQVYQLNASQGMCYCELLEGMDGKLYGAAVLGGPYPGGGAIFSLDIGLPKPLPVVSGLFPSAGAVGQKVILWGNYLLGATSVTFNGAPATTFLSTSKQSVQATVPAGATSGPVTVTTANGSYTTIQSFTVQ